MPQGREGNDLTSQEHKRIHEWDPSYLVQSAAAEEEQGLDGKIMNSTVRRSLAASHSTLPPPSPPTLATPLTRPPPWQLFPT
jgi:hypothetical protein